MELVYIFCTMERFPLVYQSQRSKRISSYNQPFFFNTLVKRRLVSAPSLGHNQAVIMQKTEYTHKLKIIQQEISFASRYNKNNAKNARQQQYKKHKSPEDVLKIIICV